MLAEKVEEEKKRRKKKNLYLELREVIKIE